MQIKDELIKRIYPKSIIEKYNRKCAYLNYKDTSYAIDFLFIKLFASILIFFIAFIISRSFIISISLIVLFNFTYNYYKFENKLLLRTKQLEKDASLFFEVLVLSLKSGKNLHESIVLTTDNIDNILANEIKDKLEDLKYGKSLIEILDDYKVNMPSEGIRNVLEGIIESYTSGKDMIPSIEKETDLLSNKRIYEIKKYINQLPIKISVISVFILIPLMLLIILSPVILDLLS